LRVWICEKIIIPVIRLRDPFCGLSFADGRSSRGMLARRFENRQERSVRAEGTLYQMGAAA